MGAKKLRPFAEILNLVPLLSDDQKLDLLDVLRGRPQRASKAKTAKVKEPKEKTAKEPQLFKEPICATCGNPEDYEDHQQPSPRYHPFTTNAKKKAAGESK